MLRDNILGLKTRPPRDGYAFNDAHSLATGTFTHIGNWHHDKAIFYRLVKNDMQEMLSLLRISNRFNYVSHLTRTSKYSGGYDCLHVFEVMKALAVKDFEAVNAFLKRYPGTSVSGHPFTVLLCNTVTSLLNNDNILYQIQDAKINKLRGTAFD